MSKCESMLSFLFGIGIFLGGLFAALFFDSFWGLIAASCFVHIAPLQVHVTFVRPVFILVFVTLITYLFSRKYPNKFDYRPVESWFMLAILIGMMLGSSNAYNPQASRDAVFVFAKFTLFFLLFINIVDSRQKLRWWINGLLLSAAWLVYRCWDLRGTTGARFENVDGGVIGDSNQFAAALILLLPLTVSKAMQSREVWWVRVGAAIGAFGIIMSIIITTSRGAFLGLLASFIMFLVYFREYRKKIILFSLLLSLAVAPFVPQYYINRTMSVFSSEDVEEDSSAQSRLTSWSLAYDLWKKHPVVGVGMNNFGYYMGYSVEGHSWGERGHVAHSIWMQALADGGLVVATPFVSLLLLFFYRLRQAKKQCKDSEIYIDISALQVGFVGFLVAATFVNRLFYEPIYWWCGMGAIHSRLLLLDKLAGNNKLPASFIT